MRAQELGDDFNLRRDFDRLLKAAVSEREEEAERKVLQALQAVRDSEMMAKEAEERADRAEAQKIELSVALASRSENVDVSSLPRSDTIATTTSHPPNLGYSRGGQHDENGGLLDELSRKAEEAELAAAVQTRRASAAESECDLLRLQLQDAQRQVRELSWQVKMSLGASGGAGMMMMGKEGGRAGNTGLSSLGSQTLDILGCGPSFTRK